MRPRQIPDIALTRPIERRARRPGPRSTDGEPVRSGGNGLWRRRDGAAGQPGQRHRPTPSDGVCPGLKRGMGSFSNFAVSFSIISILTGGITTY